MGKIPKARGFDVSIKHIRAANSVALYGSFTAAAADLGMTQSAVSRLVLQLEKQLGVSLFLRSTRNVVLTAPGREFTVSARRLIEDLNIQVENARALGGTGSRSLDCFVPAFAHPSGRSAGCTKVSQGASWRRSPPQRGPGQRCARRRTKPVR